MSVNLNTEIFLLDGQRFRATLPGLSRGITHSACVGRGDIVVVAGVRMSIASITHYWERGGSPIAPVSVAQAVISEPVTPEQLGQLREAGFQIEDVPVELQPV